MNNYLRQHISYLHDINVVFTVKLESGYNFAHVQVAFYFTSDNFSRSRQEIEQNPSID